PRRRLYPPRRPRLPRGSRGRDREIPQGTSEALKGRGGERIRTAPHRVVTAALSPCSRQRAGHARDLGYGVGRRGFHARSLVPLKSPIYPLSAPRPPTPVPLPAPVAMPSLEVVDELKKAGLSSVPVPVSNVSMVGSPSSIISHVLFDHTKVSPPNFSALP